MNAMRLLTCVVAVVALTGCESKLAVLSDEELQDKSYGCTTTADPGPGLAIACDNYRRECLTRREHGRYVC